MDNRIKRISLSVTKTAAIIIILVVAVTILRLGGIIAADSQGEYDLDQKTVTIEDALKKHSPALMSIPGVVGAAHGVCGEKDCIKVFVKEKTPALIQQVPETIEGFSVDLVETGEVHAYPEK